MQKRTIRLGIAGAISAMIGAIAYAFVRLYVMNLRVDLSVLVVNIVVFSASAAVLVYLLWKERELEEEEMFRD
ncbi:hypothetical protein [Nitrososphaera sp.]|uniref:hypothetical protein n=1 Tax=Nitrososphaera sp. TaxID=1971748 RepID=UPI0017F4B57C|nr:hypothetical protein [Nitrososphaera sp.]NWG36769.1 hypothetical protein [Nitrososphaera sp.]